MNYAVIVNIAGYLPEGEPEIYRNLTDARNGAQWHAEQFRELEYKVKGNKREGYVAQRDFSDPYELPTYISIVETDEEPED